MIKTSSLTDQELMDFAKEHVFYEIKMLHFTWIFLTSTKLPHNNQGYNAMVESFTLHARVLFEFLYPKEQIRKNDIVGNHYFESEKKYQANFPARPSDVVNIFSEISKMATHLTTFRIEYRKANKNWDLILLKQKLVSSIDLFLLNADPKKIGDVSEMRKLNWNEDRCVSVSCVTHSSITWINHDSPIFNVGESSLP